MTYRPLNDSIVMGRMDAQGYIKTEKLYVPYRTATEAYLRQFAPAIFQAASAYQAANYRADELVVLVPLDDVADEDMAAELENSRIIGYPIKVVTGIEKPLLAVDLYRSALPS